ncbi:hypothetical protein [Acidovorax sp. A1169]|uniref:phage tail tube protein n=1 Tax=Acidovorax sp. A1169 TaxID=3059524 RepID=UPI0027377DB9|nr:hypothetical protein [Acidovorax sp. A1169]MDP4074202.1 hypothetical protein [Acidovorax sp. A1169]
MALVHEEQKYTIPRGRAYFNPEDANGVLTGEIAFGNCPEVTVTIETEKAEHFSSMTGLREKDASVVVQIDRTGSLVCDNMSASNFALWMSGTREVVTQSAVAVTAELRAVIPGRFYQLGSTAGNPLGVRNVTGVTVKNEAGAVTYDAGEDYNVDLETGRIQIIEGGAITAGNVNFGYTPVASTFERVKTGSASEIRGALRIVSDNATGGERDFYMPKVTLTPDGDLPIIAEGTDFVQLSFGLEVLKPANAEAIYADGRPVVP